jgi:bisphosphoglycerate-independent phosphoglycerate mutase (AlkP superfamily)
MDSPGLGSIRGTRENKGTDRRVKAENRVPKGPRPRHERRLADVAPTALQMMELEKPPEMTGVSLLPV